MSTSKPGKPDAPEPAPDKQDDLAKPAAARPEARMGSKIVNAPTATNTGGMELKVAPAKPEVMAMAGHNQGGFELKVTQEQGVH